MERGAGAREKEAADSPTHETATEVASHAAAVINDFGDC
jgi:hypothetical protein